MDSSGVNALKEYITGTKRARFSSFVSKNKKRIPEWSIRINATSAHGLHGAWVQQYDTVHMKVKNTEKRSPRTKLCNTALWNDIFENFKRRKNAIDTFHEEAISTLTTAARPAAREVRQLIDPVTLNEESTQDTIDSRHDAEDDTEDNADLHLDSSSEELSPTSESSPPSQLSLQLRAPGRDRFQVDNVDISGKFYQMQQYVFDFVISNNLTLESDTTDRIGASVSILNLASTMDDKINKRLIVSASQLLQSLPMDPTNTDISETTLITRYIVPLLPPLFDNDDLNIRLDFTATELAEKCKRPPNFNGCPDCIITRFPHQTDDGINIGYGEVKKSSMASNHYLVNWDLVRLAFFGKNAIDDNHLGGNISIHIVAPSIVFYLIKLQSDGIYTMTELLRMQFPMSVSEVPAYLTNLPRLRNVIHISETHCNDADTSSWYRESLLATDITFLLDKKKNRKRKNTTGY
ncbi:hypothetical protein [Parasitella parasitica]|uniref:Uncharacterized protein n=1 Tax=Parasitella parasitica TaxID=35722 RepID=A0A0B7N5E9_9FUNG|nr:hypothetical protein [Parasitella parasitica]